MMAEMKTQIGSLASKWDVIAYKMEAKMDDNQEEIIKAITGACRGAPEACGRKTEAFLEKKKSAPEETEVVAEPQEVPEGATDEETIGAAKDLSRDRHLAVWSRGQLKTRTKRDGSSRQECAAAIGRPIRRTVPAMRKGKLRRGPGKKCRSGIGRRGKTPGNGVRGRIMKRDRRLRKKKTP
jgi:hypothetical protein